MAGQGDTIREILRAYRADIGSHRGASYHLHMRAAECSACQGIKAGALDRLIDAGLDAPLRPEPNTEPNTERLAAFLFRLARDDVPFGAMEEQTRVVEDYHRDRAPARYLGSAAPMGEWARQLAARLLAHDD